MARKTNGKSSPGHGGARPNSGRKPRPVNALNRKICDRLDDAIFAFELHASTMRDAKQPLDLRLDCAREVMNRVLGKPAPAVTSTNTAGALTEDDIRAAAETARADRHARGVSS